jgi:hypothetical protein
MRANRSVKPTLPVRAITQMKPTGRMRANGHVKPKLTVRANKEMKPSTQMRFHPITTLNRPTKENP